MTLGEVDVGVYLISTIQAESMRKMNGDIMMYV